MKRARQGNRAVIPVEDCGHCGKRLADDYWVVNGEGVTLHVLCFSKYREEKQKLKDMVEDFLDDT